MSNMSFDNMYKAMELRDAKLALANYEHARQLSGLTAAEIAYLDRAIPLTKERIRAAEALIGMPGA